MASCEEFVLGIKREASESDGWAQSPGGESLINCCHSQVMQRWPPMNLQTFCDRQCIIFEGPLGGARFSFLFLVSSQAFIIGGN
ncbi:hypothetical protein TNCV_2865441 [Trichonephila clavipes]|nr:hypothetical protein TNCV_2865441 [Trichonephila clavipes]